MKRKDGWENLTYEDVDDILRATDEDFLGKELEEGVAKGLAAVVKMPAEQERRILEWLTACVPVPTVAS